MQRCALEAGTWKASASSDPRARLTGFYSGPGMPDPQAVSLIDRGESDPFPRAVRLESDGSSQASPRDRHTPLSRPLVLAALCCLAAYGALSSRAARS